MEKDKAWEFLKSNDIEIVQLGVSLLFEKEVSRVNIENVLSHTRFKLLFNSDGVIIKEKSGLYDQLKNGNYTVVSKFDKKYLTEIVEKLFNNEHRRTTK